MLVRLKHSLGFISLVAVYAPTENSNLEEKDMFYAEKVEGHFRVNDLSPALKKLILSPSLRLAQYEQLVVV